MRETTSLINVVTTNLYGCNNNSVWEHHNGHFIAAIWPSYFPLLNQIESLSKVVYDQAEIVDCQFSS